MNVEIANYGGRRIVVRTPDGSRLDLEVEVSEFVAGAGRGSVVWELSADGDEWVAVITYPSGTETTTKIGRGGQQIVARATKDIAPVVNALRSQLAASGHRVAQSSRPDIRPGKTR